jgi:sec-independent protein translocase protein TatC
MNAKEKSPVDDKEQDLKEQPLISHLIELRDRILHSFLAIIVVFLAMVYWANDIYMYVSAPLTSVLDPELGEHMITTRVLDSFLVPFKLTFMLAVFICIPYLLHQAWAFIAPGLYKHEIRVTLPIIVSSVILFYTGIAFSYYLILGYMFDFFVNAAPDNVTVSTDMAAYMDFVMGLFLAFGLVFEIPVAIVLLVISGVITPDGLVEKRPYAIIGCFVVAMVLTPADPYSMILMAIPMCLLYEAGIIASRLFYKAKAAAEAENAD